MTRSLRIILLLGGIALVAGLALWPRETPVPTASEAQDHPVAAAPAKSGNKMVGTSALGHGGPTAPPTAGPTTARPGADLTARKSGER